MVGELRAGEAIAPSTASSTSAARAAFVERSRICAPLHGWVSTQSLAPADDVMEVDARPPPRSAFYAGQRVTVDDQGAGSRAGGAGWRVRPRGRRRRLRRRRRAARAGADAAEPLARRGPRGHRGAGRGLPPRRVNARHADYYALRFELVQSLIELKGVSVVAVEGDASRRHASTAYVRGTSPDRTAEEALRGFTGGRGTTPWLWRNKEGVHFVEWLRERNASSAAACGFAGLDLFSARASARMVVEYLELVDPASRRPAGEPAADRYGCFLAASEEEYSKACLEDARATRAARASAWMRRGTAASACSPSSRRSGMNIGTSATRNGTSTRNATPRSWSAPSSSTRSG